MFFVVGEKHKHSQALSPRQKGEKKYGKGESKKYHTHGIPICTPYQLQKRFALL